MVRLSLAKFMSSSRSRLGRCFSSRSLRRRGWSRRRFSSQLRLSCRRRWSRRPWPRPGRSQLRPPPLEGAVSISSTVMEVQTQSTPGKVKATHRSPQLIATPRHRPGTFLIPVPPVRDDVSSRARADACHGDDSRRDGARPVVGACPGGLGLGLNNLDYSLLLGKVRRSGFSFPLGCGSTLGVGAAPDPRTCTPSCSLEGEWERWRKVDLAPRKGAWSRT